MLSIEVSSTNSALPHSVRDRYNSALEEVKSEYLSTVQSFPWIVAFSGGKDSTLVFQLVVEAMLQLEPERRTRPVYVLANDTLVESPLVAEHLDRCLERIRSGCDRLGLPVIVDKTTPRVDQTFWVNLIGRGYPSPNRMFRWCTDRMKIQPTSDYVRDKVSAAGEVILLIGVRRAESATRAASVERYAPKDGTNLNRHNDLKGCWVFRPIVDFSTDEVWQLLMQRPPPWGGSHRDLITLYKNAQGGECPLVIDKSQAAGCGTSSSRFGCWTCTVVDKDRSLTNMIESMERSADYDRAEQYNELLEFRDWLVQIARPPDDPRRLDEWTAAYGDWREPHRRGGQVRLKKDGETSVRGPFTLKARRQVLARLLQVQERTGLQLISTAEREKCEEIWLDDETKERRATMDALLRARRPR